MGGNNSREKVFRNSNRNNYEEHFDLLTSKYDWLHFHLTVQDCTPDWTNYYPVSGPTYYSSNSVPQMINMAGYYRFTLHFISKSIWINTTDDEISSAREALRVSKNDTREFDRTVAMAKRLNERDFGWWETFYGDASVSFKFSSGYSTKCSVAEETRKVFVNSTERSDETIAWRKTFWCVILLRPVFRVFSWSYRKLQYQCASIVEMYGL